MQHSLQLAFVAENYGGAVLLGSKILFYPGGDEMGLRVIGGGRYVIQCLVFDVRAFFKWNLVRELRYVLPQSFAERELGDVFHKESVTVPVEESLFPFFDKLHKPAFGGKKNVESDENVGIVSVR